jgi:hypothetical protein
MSMANEYWAYDFACGKTLEDILASLNSCGPWRWTLNESSWYGDYLNCRPMDGVRLRIHQYPQSGEGGYFFTGLRGKGFSALLEAHAGSPAERTGIDEIFRSLLGALDASGITDIAYYD